MAGTGTYLASIFKAWLGTGVGGCGGCEQLLKEMDSHSPEWTRQNLRTILPTIERNARKSKDWKARILARIPGIRLPIVSLIFLAAAWAEEDLKDAAEREANRP